MNYFFLINTFIILLCSNFSFSQVVDSFEDMDFNSNPTWTGTEISFEVVNPPTSGNGSIDLVWSPDGHLLRSKPDCSDAALFVESNRAYGQWTFSIADGRGWSVSGANDFFVVLISDTNTPENFIDNNIEFNGYYLRFDGSSEDSFVLYRQDGTTSTEIIETSYPQGNDGTTSLPFSVKITRDNDGLWQLFIDEGLYVDAFTLRGEIVDNTITAGNYFGIVTNISNPSSARVVYIDDVHISPLVIDGEPPVVTNQFVNGNNHLVLQFDEMLDSASFSSSSISIDGNNEVIDIDYYFDDYLSVQLIFENSFVGENTINIQINGIADLDGNSVDTSFNFPVPDILETNIFESFSDGQFSSNPSWTGDESNFVVVDPINEGDGSLDLLWNDDGQLLQSVPYSENGVLLFETIRNYGQWSFSITEGTGWAISGSNDFYIILISNTNDVDLLQPDNLNFYGYFLRYDGTMDDNFVLYRQEGSVSVPILNSGYPTGSDGVTSIPYSIKIVRHLDGLWQMFINEGMYLDATNLVGEVVDNEIETGRYFGIGTNISNPSESRVVYLDDIYTGEIVYDTLPPLIVNVEVTGDNELMLDFSESIDSSMVFTESFMVSNSIGNPESIEYSGENTTLKLTFANQFPIREECTILIENIVDLAGNTMEDTVVSFVWNVPVEGDVVINEVYFDTYPTIGLPEYDFLELYNRSEYSVNLKGWILSIGDDNRIFSEYEIASGEYLIVTSSAAQEEYSLYGDVADVITTTLLSNNGEEIKLQDSTGNTIHWIEYSSSWYHDDEKEDGGWSIEQIDPDSWCAQSGNWRASVDTLGGTPGRVNSVNAVNPDSIPAAIVFAAVLDRKTIAFKMSEECPLINFNSTHISLSIDAGVLIFVQDENDPKLWQIQTVLMLPEREVFQLAVHEIPDFCDNILTDTVINMICVPSVFQQVVINEVMPDPNMDLGQAYEYVELYNRDTLPVSVSGWTFSAGSKEWLLPVCSIPPNGYIVLVPENLQGYPQAPSNCLYLFDEADLSNSSAMLKFSDANGQLVTWLEYDVDWHSNEFALQGGYSLERIDQNCLCCGEKNWSTCEASSHGTPGFENSNVDHITDTEAPAVLHTAIEDQNTILFMFDKPIWPDSVLSNIQIEGLYVDSAFAVHPNGKFVKVKVSQQMDAEKEYIANLFNFRDCNNNTMEQSEIEFMVPGAPAENDLVINEVLFNPYPDGSDFIEVYNISDKYLALDQLYFSNIDDLGYPENIHKGSDIRFILSPNEYIVFTENYECQEEVYFPFDRLKTFVVDLPSMPNGEGRIALLDTAGKYIDAMNYNESMHHALLSNIEGVSLERISPWAESGNPYNWYSASQDAGFATPTRENSQFKETSEPAEQIELGSETISPDGDGYEDYMQINYTFNPGTLLNVRILNRNGIQIKQLVNNLTTSTNGFITWDGTNDQQHKVSTGIYILVADWFDESGHQGNYKNTVVVAGELK